jgi:hypothetical protein
MTIRHAALFTWVDGVSPDQLAAVTRGLDELPSVVPNIEWFEHGPDLGINDGNAHHAVVADFATLDDYLAYRDHPDHQALLAGVIRPILAARTAVQYEVRERGA